MLVMSNLSYHMSPRAPYCQYLLRACGAKALLSRQAGRQAGVARRRVAHGASVGWYTGAALPGAAQMGLHAWPAGRRAAGEPVGLTLAAACCLAGARPDGVRRGARAREPGPAGVSQASPIRSALLRPALAVS